MPVEIERKFLVTGTAWHSPDGQRIVQGYLNRDKARTVRVRGGKPQVENGPYLAEGVGGYLVLEAESMDAAVALAARVPAARLGGAVEIRPAERYW